MPIEETLSRLPVLVVAAHPDDETIGAGGMLGRMANPYVLHVTDGAPRNPDFARAAGYRSREEYARARRRELSPGRLRTRRTPAAATRRRRG